MIPLSPSSPSIQDRLCVALDVPDRDQALRLVETLAGTVGYFKIGLELFCLAGPGIVSEVVSQSGCNVFLDLKFHDIPNTVAAAVRQVAGLGATLINLHASGGMAMMSAAQKALAESGKKETRLIAVTILTSLNQTMLEEELGWQGGVQDHVLQLACNVKSAGLSGVVCSPQEILPLRENLGKEFLIVTPGIRPAGGDVHDQQRILTPRRAIEQGSSLLVIGRPITAAPNPREAAMAILEEIAPVA